MVQIFLITINLFYSGFSLNIKYSECYEAILNGSRVCGGNDRCHVFFGCQCPNGFGGSNCEELIKTVNPCDFHKCHPDAVCINLTSTKYYCQCPPNRTGEFCETMDPCFDCRGRCFEIDYDVLECVEEENLVSFLILKRAGFPIWELYSFKAKSNKSIRSVPDPNSSSIESTVFDEAIIESLTLSPPPTEDRCPDTCLYKLYNHDCDEICNTSVCSDFETICHFEIDPNLQLLNILLIISIMIIIFVLLVFIVKLGMRRWKRISAEIAAELAIAEEARRIQSEPVYCEI